MKKNIICYLLIFTLIFSNFTTVSAASTDLNDSQEENYWTETIEYFIPNAASVNTLSTSSTTKYIGAKKTISYENAGKVLWSMTLNATFHYVAGKSSACDSVTISAKSNYSEWKITSKNASKSGNKATGTVTAKHYVTAIPIQTITKTATLTCDVNGKIK